MGTLYTKSKIFHYQDKLDSLPHNVDKILPPIHIRIKPTNVCAHSCWYCAYKADNLQLGKDMIKKDMIPREKMMEIIDDAIEMKVQAITFSGGGEPFLYPFLLDAAKKLASSQIKFASLTNGSRLQDEVSEVFAHHATWVRVSMDGWDDASYIKYRRTSDGEYTRILANMKTFKKLGGKCYLGVSLIIDKDNASHVYESLMKLKDVGVNSVKASPCIVSNDSLENSIYHRPFFDSVKEQISRAISDFSDANFEIFDAYHELDLKFKKNYNWCAYLQILHVIGADLNVYACQDKAYNLEEGLLGSIKNVRYRDFWMNDKSKFFTINPSVVCNHHCVANTKNELVHDYLDVDKDHMMFV
jgi:sulfatase maturation enzyme AslB (radical SAM superfamily)